MSCLSSSGNVVYEDIRAWIVDNGSSSHMTGMRSMFLSFLEIDSDCHVGCGSSTTHAVNGVGCVKFQPESRGSLEVVEMLFVPELKVNLLSILALVEEGYGVVFQRGQELIYPKGVTQDVATVLSVKYRLLGHPVIGSKRVLNPRSVSVSETDGCKTSSSTVRRLS